MIDFTLNLWIDKYRLHYEDRIVTGKKYTGFIHETERPKRYYILGDISDLNDLADSLKTPESVARIVMKQIVDKTKASPDQIVINLYSNPKFQIEYKEGQVGRVGSNAGHYYKPLNQKESNQILILLQEHMKFLTSQRESNQA